MKQLNIFFLFFGLLLLSGCSNWLAPNNSNIPFDGVIQDINLNKSNSLPTQDIDSNERESLNTVFGDKIVGSRVPSIAAQFQYPLQTTDIRTPEIITTGSIDQEEAMLDIHTGNSSNGSASIESISYLRYLPGHESQALFTPVFSKNINIRQRAGIFDLENGFFFEWNGITFKSCRRRSSIDFCENINLTGVFNGVDLNPTLGNVYSISYGYLGFAPISFSVMTPEGGWTLLNKIKFPNTATKTHILKAFLPMRAESTNMGNTNDSILSIGSIWGGIVDGNVKAGSKSDPTARFFTHESPIVSNSASVIFAFKSKSTFGNISNRIDSLLKLVSCSTDGNKPVKLRLLKNPQYLSATWKNVSPNSILEYSDDLILNVSAENGESFLYWSMGKSDSFFKNIENQNLLLPPNGVAVFYFESQNSNTVQCSIRWAELF